MVLDLNALHGFLLALSVLVAAAAALLSTAAAEQPGVTKPWRWHAQGIAAAALMFALMAEGVAETPSRDPIGTIALLVVAGALGLTASSRLDGQPFGPRSLRLSLDASIVAVGFSLAQLVVLPQTAAMDPASALLPAAFAGAAYAVLVASRGALRTAPFGADGLLVLGTVGLGVFVVGEVCYRLSVAPFGGLAAPGVEFVCTAALAASGLVGQRQAGRSDEVVARDDSRLRFVPALVAGVAIVLLSLSEIAGNGGRVGFFGVVVLFGLIVARLVSTLRENRRLLWRVERSGVFEEKLRDLGAALLAALDRTEALELVCRTAQVSFGSEWVLLWMVDHSTGEIEAAEVLGPRRASLLHRRITINDASSLAARVARTGEPEIVTHASTANMSNQFLNVLMHAQSLLAVPIARSQVVQGVLVCVDSKNPVGFGMQELAKAELLASQVGVALDNAYQHDLQRRRLEEVTALYKFAQSAHAATTSAEIARQLMPILRERLRYTYAAVWVRDGSGSPRLAAGDSPGGVPLAGVRPSPLAMEAISTGNPVHAGLGWAVGEDGSGYQPPRTGIRSQLAVPLVLRRRVVGVVDLESKQANAYSLNDERLLVSLANHAALAIDNLDLVEETRKVEALKELDRMKSELLSTVSHELRTPLGSIKGYATTLLTHDTKLRREEKREFLEIIDSEADRLRELIENLLDLSRLEAGVLRLDPVQCRLGNVAWEVIRNAQLAAATTGHTIELEWPEDRDVVADSRRIYQVMQNLVSNAVKYSPGGGRITLIGEFTQRELLVRVVDEGLGLPPREVDRIFDRFHRVGGERARQIGGTGLGLAICRAFVEAHGGRIWAESPGEGLGSSFHFTVPLVAPVLAATKNR